ncbi:MAG: sulfatase-like hydrolase/transferase [Planctomyces sp.]|nr:sulfatase-like hydrolase/transferase [Planctomyces sp.]
MRMFLAAMFAVLWLVADGRSVAADRPNVLFLLTDDQRADTIGALGNPAIRTPHMDGLVQRGFAFRNAYCLGSNMPAVCTPSRNMLFSGRAYFRWDGPQAPADASNFPASMNAAGYETWHYGKRGNTAVKIQELFEHNRYLEDDEAARTSGEPGAEIVDAAIEFLSARKPDRPFFMCLAFAAPHDPRVAAEAYRDEYDPAEIPLPRNFLPLHPFNNGEQLVRDELLAPFPRTAENIRAQLHDYYATITGLDHHIGRLLKSLDDRGLADETLIVFTSDHGLSLGSHGLMGKQNLYEHSLRVPLVFAGPGIPQGESAALASLMDIFPTVCELTGATAGDGLDGRSLAAVLRGDADAVRESLFFAYRDVQRGIRTDRWKMIFYPRINRVQVFDLAADPDELKDLSTDFSTYMAQEELIQKLRALQAELGDEASLASVTPEDAAFTPPATE